MVEIEDSAAETVGPAGPAGTAEARPGVQFEQDTDIQLVVEPTATFYEMKIV